MKKIIILIASLAIMISILNISAYAVDLSEAEDSGWHDSGETITRMTSQEYYAAQADIIAKFCDGKITYSEFQEQSQAVTDEFVTSNTVGGVINAGVLTASNTISALSQKIGATVQKYGDSARDYISNWISDYIDEYSVLSNQSTTDMMGGGVKIVITYKSGSTRIIVGSYATLSAPDSWGRRNIVVYGEGGQYDLQKDGTYKLTQSFNSDGFWHAGNPVFSDGGNVDLSGNIYKLYGDIRTLDGENFPTDDEYELVKGYDFTELPETALEDLINDMTEEFERQDPDLSTIEGLLRAIYARMGKLDSDNDNQLLAAINANILKLINADKDKDDNNYDNEETNEDLVKTLLEIRDLLKEGNFGIDPEAHGHEISGTVYNVIPLDKNFLNKLLHDTENLKVEYEGKVYYLEDCGCIKLGEKYYTPNMNYDSYAFADYDFSNDNIEINDSKYLSFDLNNPLNLYNNLSFTQRKKIDNIVNSIYQMVTYAVPYASITMAFAPFEVIIFNTAVPEDIVLNFNGYGDFGSFSATILSVSFFQNSYVSSAMGIVKPFLTVVIGYSWLKVMRRKAVSMLG